MVIKNKIWQGSLFFKTRLGLLFFAFILAVTACSTTNSGRRRYPLLHDKAPIFRINVNRVANAVPRAEPLSKRGNPRSYVVLGHRYYVLRSAKGYHARGIASWYGMKFHHFETANGEFYSVAGMTAAHRTLPLPTYLQVTNLRNGKKIIVKVNDRGPFVKNRLIDLSYVAAKKLDMIASGTALVEIRAVTSGMRLARNTNITHHHTSQRKSHSAGSAGSSFVHLGIFKQREQAQQLARLVKQWKHYPVKVEKKIIHKRPYYQLVIGPVATKNSQKLRRQLQLAELRGSKPIN